MEQLRGAGTPPTAGEDGASEWTLRGVRVPQALLTPCPPPCAGAEDVDEDGLLLVDLCVADGRIASISRSYSSSTTTQGGAEDRQNGRSLVVDGRGRVCLPAFVDVHTHIDKSHTCERSRNENGSLSGADRSTCDDARFWTLEDATRRMRFCLECAHHHGTMAVRTHLISVQHTQRQIAWAAFTALRDEWKGRLELQGVALSSAQNAMGPERSLAQSGATLDATMHLRSKSNLLELERNKARSESQRTNALLIEKMSQITTLETSRQMLKEDLKSTKSSLFGAEEKYKDYTSHLREKILNLEGEAKGLRSAHREKDELIATFELKEMTFELCCLDFI